MVARKKKGAVVLATPPPPLPPVETPAPVAAPTPRAAMQPIPTMGYIVTEAEPMKGVSPLPPVYFDTQQEAIDYGITRIPLFGRVEVSIVLYRALTELVPQTTLVTATEE